MPAWLVAAALVVAGVMLIAVSLQRLSLRFSLRALGEARGFWAVAGAATAGPLILTLVAATGRPRMVTLRCFGFKLGLERPAAPQAMPRMASAGPVSGAKGSGLRRRGWLRARKPIDWVVFLIAHRALVINEGVVLRVSYDLSDIAMTGKLSAVLATLEAVVPEGFTLEHRPCWSGADTWRAEVEGAVRIKVMSLLWHTARFMLAPRRDQQPTSLKPETGAA